MLSITSNMNGKSHAALTKSDLSTLVIDSGHLEFHSKEGQKIWIGGVYEHQISVDYKLDINGDINFHVMDASIHVDDLVTHGLVVFHQVSKEDGDNFNVTIHYYPNPELME